MVHARVGADEPMACFGDQHAIAANDAPRLPQNDFNGARIFFQPRGDSEGLRRRLYACQADEGAFCLGDNFLSDDEDVAVFEVDGGSTRGAGHAFDKIIARANFRNASNWK